MAERAGLENRHSFTPPVLRCAEVLNNAQITFSMSPILEHQNTLQFSWNRHEIDTRFRERAG